MSTGRSNSQGIKGYDMKERKITRKIITDEMDEQSHPVLIEDVIFWSLEYYGKNFPENTFGRTVARYLVDRIKEEENKRSSKEN